MIILLKKFKKSRKQKKANWIKGGYGDSSGCRVPNMARTDLTKVPEDKMSNIYHPNSSDSE